MTAPVQEQPPAPEELVLGPRRRRELPRWVPPVALALGIAVLAAAALWRFWPRPIEPLSLSELQDTYAGLVRADGTNDASVMTRQTVAEDPVTVTPAVCAPLVEATVANRFSDAARDGVSTYWIARASTISLFTLRFDDADSAEAEQNRIATALDACVDHQIVVRRTAQDTSPRPWRATVARTAVSAGAGGIGYTLAAEDGVTAMELLPYLNTLSWQYRYETGATSYDPLAAEQLMQNLHGRLDAVVAARPPR